MFLLENLTSWAPDPTLKVILSLFFMLLTPRLVWSFLTCTICLFLSYLQHNFSKIRHEKAVNLFWHHYGVVKPVTALWFYLDSALWKNILISAEAYLGYDDTLKWKGYPANIYLFKINIKNTRTTSLTSYWCFYC